MGAIPKLYRSKIAIVINLIELPNTDGILVISC